MPADKDMIPSLSPNGSNTHRVSGIGSPLPSLHATTRLILGVGRMYWAAGGATSARAFPLGKRTPARSGRWQPAEGVGVRVARGSHVDLPGVTIWLATNKPKAMGSIETCPSHANCMGVISANYPFSAGG